MKTLFIIISSFWLAFSVNAQMPTVSSRRVLINTKQSSTKTGVRLYKNDIVYVQATGTATYGYLVSLVLGRLTAAGSDDVRYTKTWGRAEYKNYRYGAVLCRVGSDVTTAVALRPDFRECLTGPFNIGVCSPVSEPVVGTLFTVKTDGELTFDINDRLCIDNSDSYLVDVIVFSTNTDPIDHRQQTTNSNLLCGLITGANAEGYDSARMQQVVQTGNTDVFDGFAELNSYYRFLNDHSVVRTAGIRWQQVAIEVTGLLLLANQLLAELREPSDNQTITDIKFAVWVSYLVLTSERGKQFMEGTASRGLAKHITNQFYRPLIRGEYVVIDPFRFDAMAVYAEQYNPDLQDYYKKFNHFDRQLVEGAHAQIFARLPGCSNPTWNLSWSKTFHITEPVDRLYIGLYKMGYTSLQIQGFIEEIKRMENTGLKYSQIISNLKKVAMKTNIKDR